MIRCPHCDHGMNVKGLHAGTYSPRCPKCSKKFTIAMESDTSEPVVSAAAGVGAGASAGPKATIAPPGKARPTSAGQTMAPEAPSPRAAATSAEIPLEPEIPVAPPPERPGMTTQPRKDKSSPDDFVVREAPKVYQQSVGRMAGQQGPARLPLTGKLGGYELKRKLGQGGMGTVYLARQVSLDRDVAVKVLAGELAQDAQFVSRFVREAYAAAQLVHHNVVQIHDIGEEERNHFFSMEFVKGQSLADVIRSEGAVIPDTAAGYILQAARGLKMAHDQGMIHRDIKPENLLVSSDGIVKVADLGLVKRQGAQDIIPKVRREQMDVDASQTAAHSTMGTPAYMAPEQAEDAAGVDARADIYSLGCTLFALLTGRPPFTGKTAEEVLAAAKKGVVPAPRTVNEKVPSELSRITRLMTQKRKEERYANIAQVIHDLEQYLGVEGTGVFSPRQQHVDDLEQCVKLFDESRLARIRRAIVSIFVVGVLLAAGLLIYNSQHWAWATGCVGMLAMTSVFYVIIASVTGGSYFAMRLRQLVIHARWRDWMRWGAIAGLSVLAVVALGLTVPVTVLALLSLVLAAGFRFTIDEMVTSQRKHAVAHADDMFRGFRLKGLDEDSVRRFACDYSGRKWEEFFEAVFGYEAKVEARQRWGRSARYRPKYGAWRDPIIRWISHREEVVRQEKERKHLLRVETKAIEAQGVNEVAAARQGKKMAEMMMAQAEDLRQRALRERDEPGKTVAPEAAGSDRVQKARELFRFDEEGERFVYKKKGYIARRYGGPMEWIFGPRMRFAMAAIILLGFLMWRYDNRGGIVKELEDLRGTRIDPTVQDLTKVIDTRKVVEMAAQTTRPLRVPAVPDFVCDAVGSWNGGVAGGILLIGSFLPSLTIGIPLLAAALMALFGEYLPVLGDASLETRKSIALFAGAGAALVTFLLVKRQA